MFRLCFGCALLIRFATSQSRRDLWLSTLPLCSRRSSLASPPSGDAKYVVVRPKPTRYVRDNHGVGLIRRVSCGVRGVVFRLCFGCVSVVFRLCFSCALLIRFATSQSRRDLWLSTLPLCSRRSSLASPPSGDAKYVVVRPKPTRYVRDNHGVGLIRRVSCGVRGVVFRLCFGCVSVVFQLCFGCVSVVLS